MDNEKNRPLWFSSTVSFEGNQKVTGNISDSIMTFWLARPMPNTGVVAIGQDACIRDSCRKEVAGPEHSGMGAIVVLMGCREGNETS